MRGLILCLMAIGGVEGAAAASHTLQAAADNTIFSENTNSNGAGQHLFTGRIAPPNTDVRRALLRFDLSTLPPGATIREARLRLVMNKTIAGATPVRVHRLTASWGEGSSDAFGEEGTGIAPAAGDATWLHREFSGTPWASPGGDFIQSASATTSVAGNGPHLWEGAGLVADVQRWIDFPQENLGWILIGDESQGPTAKRFASRQHPSASDRPLLELVLDEPGHYDVWRSTHFSAGEPAPDSGDPDGDGLPNALEYGWGFDPKKFDQLEDGLRVEIDSAAQAPEMQITFRRDSRATDLAWRLQVSPDLQQWETVVAVSAGGAPSGPWLTGEEPLPAEPAFRRVGARDPEPGTRPRLFVRLQVERTP